jgi:hypothetical protein
MLAYKFRAAENLHFVIDIIVHRRLYCAPTETLNDVREGDVRVGQDEGREVEILEYGMEVNKKVRELRVCALTKSFDNHLLWAHYAGGYGGIAFELDVPDEDLGTVDYGNNFLCLSNYAGVASPETAARSVLLKKYKDWSYEQEVRLVTKEPFYALVRPIKRIILGSRASSALTATLQILCSHYQIELERMVVADWGIYTVGSQESPQLRKRGDA